MKPASYADVVTKAVLPNEIDRLAALCRMFAPATERVLTAAGPRPGMRCLDAGAGSGEVANWLAAQVREVVALDAETGMLAGRCAPNVRIVEADLCAADAPDLGVFDLVHARFVLQAVPDPEAALRRLVSWLAPGGVLVLGDSWFPPLHGTMTDTLVQVHAAVQRLAEFAGADWAWATRLPAAMSRHGLHGIGTTVDAPRLAAHSDHATFLGLLFALCRPHLVAAGLATDEEIDVATADLDRADLNATPYLMITSSGRKGEA